MTAARTSCCRWCYGGRGEKAARRYQRRKSMLLLRRNAACYAADEESITLDHHVERYGRRRGAEWRWLSREEMAGEGRSVGRSDSEQAGEKERRAGSMRKVMACNISTDIIDCRTASRVHTCFVCRCTGA